MNILDSEIEGYQKLRKEAELILTECQKLTNFTKLNEILGYNLAKEYADIYIALKEFKRSVLMTGKMSERDYVFCVGILEGRISEKTKTIQMASNYDINLHQKVDEFLISKAKISKYLLDIMD